jgi:hypothetical protein
MLRRIANAHAIMYLTVLENPDSAAYTSSGAMHQATWIAFAKTPAPHPS